MESFNGNFFPNIKTGLAEQIRTLQNFVQAMGGCVPAPTSAITVDQLSVRVQKGLASRASIKECAV